MIWRPRHLTTQRTRKEARLKQENARLKQLADELTFKLKKSDELLA